ncbi:response regulator [Candidatus Nitrospira allomarina]|uniref:Response regulator n=1 Tax=Candidatus Nitrospira allomarina TaxID=3020900 RepID=A0AA96GDB6_9BACT|nr:response regulator [Candidatus Nitrospira allomarina]WNM56674.1 response regulator [Candidatus Nitrospira allomarina]
MPNPIEILLIEDNPADIRLTQEAFQQARLQNTIHVVQDGVNAMAFIRQTAPFQQAPRPDLILLDLNLPKKDGREVLKEIKSDTHTRTIPVVVLTTSDDEADVLRSYDLHANAYLVKPIDILQFIKMIQSLEDFWLSVVKLPPKVSES